MATFGKSEGEGTIIGTHVKLSGILSDPNDIVILGQLEGEVHSERSVTIGPAAHVKGPITAARVILGGTVKGNITTKDRLEILSKGKLSGNIETRDLIIHSGARFSGRCRIIGEETEDETGETQPAALTGKPTPQEGHSPSPSRALFNAPDLAPEPAQGQKTEEEPRRRVWPGIRIGNFRRKDSQEKTPSKDEPKEARTPGYEIEE